MNIELKEKKINVKLILGIFTIIFLLIFISGFLLLNKNNIPNQVKTSVAITYSNSPTPTSQIEYANFTNYFVPVTGFKELRNDITLDELKTLDLKVMTSENNEIKSAFPEYKITSLDDSSFIDEIANGNNIALVSWKNLSPKLKSLSINNKFLFDKTIDLKDYPLQSTIKLSKLDADNLTQFDQKKINRILATGEIIPARTVDKYMRNKNDYKYPFESVKPFMDLYDAQISTFETALVGSGNGPSCALGCMTFQGNEKFMEGMRYSGVDVVSLADNHSMNGGIEGIANTIKLMNDAGIKTVGAAPTNNEDATKPAIIEVGGTKYGILGYNDIPSVSDWATDIKGGTARIDDNNYHIIQGRVAKDVQRAKDAGAKFVIAMMHWGAREYTNEPLQHQKELAYNLIDSGVDLIVGDHPHWVGAVEFYKNKFIYYGIGNFIFDQDWSIETSQGSLLEMNFYEDKILSLEIHPHQITLTQPRLLSESSKEYKQIFNRIWQYTGKI